MTNQVPRRGVPGSRRDAIVVAVVAAVVIAVGLAWAAVAVVDGSGCVETERLELELAAELGYSPAAVVAAWPVAVLAQIQTCHQASHWQRAESNRFCLHARVSRVRQTL